MLRPQVASKANFLSELLITSDANETLIGAVDPYVLIQIFPSRKGFRAYIATERLVSGVTELVFLHLFLGSESEMATRALDAVVAVD